MSANYKALGEYLRTFKGEQIKLTMKEIEMIIGPEWPSSAYEYEVWWSNSELQALPKVWLKEGFKRKKIVLKEYVILCRVKPQVFNKAKKVRDNKIADLVEKIHNYILDLDDRLYYKELKSYHGYKEIGTQESGPINIEAKNKGITVPIYCMKELEELKKIVENKKLKLEGNGNKSSHGKLKLRPIITNEKEFNLIKPLIEFGVEEYFNNKKNCETSIVKSITKIEKIEKKLKELEGKEREALVKQRVNQSDFRKGLIEKYKKCCLCGITDERILVASHIKPWSKSNSIEKLDLNNGLLLCSNHDALFDKGIITFDIHGKMMISESLKEHNRVFSNVKKMDTLKIELNSKIREYLNYHKENEFIDNNS